MKKTYKSNIILSIVTSFGQRISFDELSDGGSTFHTDDERIQKEIENHPFFGTKIKFTCETLDAIRMAKEAANKPEEFVAEEQVQTAAKEHIECASIQDAKEILADRYGAMRSCLRNKKSILEFAEKVNVELVINE